MNYRHWERLSGKALAFPELGFGTAPLGNLYQAVTEEDAQQALEAAWRSGCRYFDTAPLYGLGLAETRLNTFLRDKPRDDYVLSTKVGRLLEPCEPSERTGIGKFFNTPNRREVYDYSHDGILRSVEFSLERLGVDRIDVLFAHDLDIFTHGSQAALQIHLDQFIGSGIDALVSLRDQGVILGFGAGINEWQPAQWIAERGDPDLFLLAGRYTLLEQEALDSFLPLCEKRGIGIVLGGPYNSGILATGAVEGAYYNYDPAPANIMEKVNRMEQVCLSHGTKLIEAALRFPLHHPSVVSIIPGGQSSKQVLSNRDVLDRGIPESLWRDLKEEGLVRADAPTPP